MKVYFLGGGNMASAIAGGLVKQNGFQVHIANRSAEKRERLAAELGVAVSEKLPELTAEDVLVLAVKPQDMQAACAGLQTNGALVLSVAAGLSVNTLSRYLGGATRIVRTMPNLPSKIGLGVSGMFAEPNISQTDRDVADRIMKAAGQTVWLETEDQMHAITGICGSGSGYVFYLLDALRQAAEVQGFDAATARELSLSTFKGAAALAESSSAAFRELQDGVTSKGGTTAAALAVFDQRGIKDGIAEGVNACVERSQAIALQFEAV